MKTIPLTQGRSTLVDDYDYDTFSPFKWNYARGYATRCSRRSDDSWAFLSLHRLIALAREEEQVHHINGEKLDNRKENLQIVTIDAHISKHVRENWKNRGPVVGKYRGVTWHITSKRWTAGICINNKSIHLGNFDTPEEAAVAWDVAARNVWGKDYFQNCPKNKDSK